MNVIQIIFVSLAGLTAIMMPVLFMQSRRVGKTAKALELLMLDASRAKIADAKKLVDDALSGVVSKISENFNSMTIVLKHHAARAEELQKKLGTDNKVFLGTADAAAERIRNMVRTLENLALNLSEIVGGDGWKSILAAAENFNKGANTALKELEVRSAAISHLSGKLDASFSDWSKSGRILADNLHHNLAESTDKINLMSVAVKGMNDELSELQKNVTADFENVKSTSHGIENTLENNSQLLSQQIEKIGNFSDQAKKLLQSQVNTMSDTAARVGTNIRLAESSIEAGADNLNTVVEKLFVTSKAIKETFDVIAGEIMDIRAKFQTEVGEFSKTVVDNLQTAQAATAHTMENAGHIAMEFKDSLVPMLTNITGAIDGIGTAQEKIQPLVDMIERVNSALPRLANESDGVVLGLTQKIDEMAGKIFDMNDAASKALRDMGDGAMTLQKLTGESRQQMIDLVDDYTKAAKTVKELSIKPDALSVAPAPTSAGTVTKMKVAPARVIPVQDFTTLIEGIMEKLHNLSVDLTRSIGAEIPSSIMDKYNNGDRAIFSKWFAKMISSADKKRVRDMFKTDAVFRSQATHFVHGFSKMLAGAERTENKDMVTMTLLKTDLGIMYQALKACL